MLDDVALCVHLGWTHAELMSQPSRFIERLIIYVNTAADQQQREQQRLEDEIRNLRNRK